ncbi:XrtA/PEP-CTERM system TPR-repeat protein PrsT [Thalassotalea agariperforans]
MTQVNKWLKVLVTSSMVMGSYACTDSKTVEEYQVDIAKFIEQKDHKSAIIALKNAVAIAPNNAELRFQLGNSYVNQGDYAGAEKELEKAEQLGFDPIQNLPRLIETKFKLNKYDEVYSLTQAADALPDSAYVQALTYAGLSSLYQGEREQAKEYIDSANQISSESVYGQIGKAYLANTAEEAEKSLKVLDSLIAYAPDIADTYLLKAYLLQGAQQYLASAKAFEAYAQLRPQEYQVQFFIAQNYLSANELDKAEPVINKLLKISEHHPLTNQMKAQIEFDRKNYQAAKDFGVKAYQQKDDLTFAIIIAGMSSYYLGDYEQSYKQLIKVKNKVSAEHLVNKVLVELQLRLGYDNEALESINQLSEAGTASTSLLTAASNELLKSGNKAAAQELLQQSINLNSDNPTDVTNQGIMKLKLNELGSGIEMLENALKLDPNSEKAEAGLALGYLDNQQFEQALAIAKKWQTKEDKKIQGLLLESEIANKQKDLDKAKQLLRDVLAIDESNIPAIYKLAFYAHSANEVDSAFGLYEKLLKIKSDHLRGIINFTRFVSTNPEFHTQAINLYQKNIDKDQNDNYAKLGLAYIYKVTNNHKKAVDLYLQILESRQPIEDIEVALGDSYIELKNIPAAISAYKKLLDKKTGNLLIGQRLLNVYEVDKQYDNALTLVEQLYKEHQANDGLLLYKVYFQSKLNKPIVPQDIQKLQESAQIAKHWLLNKVLGNRHYNNKSFSLAIIEYQSAYNKKPISKNAADLAKTLVLAGEYGKSIAFMEKHLLENPQDITLQVMLAGAYLTKKKDERAREIYKQVLVSLPEHIIALNNLAYLELQKGNNRDALKYAEKSVSVAPQLPAVLDTYGQVLAANNKLIESIAAYDKALLLDRDNIEISINKAKALILNNQVQAAKSLLISLSTDNVSEDIEIKHLLNNLQ